MPNLIVSTCGTSLLTNDADQELRRLLVTHANAKANDIDANDRRRIDEWTGERRRQLLEADDDDAARLSAELNGLLAYYRDLGRSINDADQDRYYLVVTDTHVGEQAFQCISAWLKNKGRTATKITAGGLNTSDIGSFRVALADIVKYFDVTLDLAAWRGRQYRVVFNLTGGFKSVNGFMQTIGMLFADECFYLFEGSRCRPLMRVPRLPIRLDARQAFVDNLESVRRMANGEVLTQDECGTLPETFLFEVPGDDSVQLSEWGEAFWAMVRREIYGGSLMEPLSGRLRLSDDFRGQVRKRTPDILRQPDRLYTLNQRLDDLARYLETNENLERLDFKQLRGNRIPPCTHEIDVWGDQEYRGFGRYEKADGGEVFVIECIARGLH